MNFLRPVFNTASSAAFKIQRIMNWTQDCFDFLHSQHLMWMKTLGTVSQFSSKHILYDAPPPPPMYVKVLVFVAQTR